MPTSNEPIYIAMEEGLEDFVPEYLANRRKELPLLETLLKAGEFDRIRRMAHDIKGTGNGFGFPRLTELASAMEVSAKELNAEAIEGCLASLRSYLERVRLKE